MKQKNQHKISLK